MTLHLLKNPRDPLALKTLAVVPPPQGSSAVVLLTDARDLPSIPGVPIYALSDHPRPDKHTIGYPQLVEMIFHADKVITW